MLKILIPLFLFSLSCFAADSEPSVYVICKRGDEVRTLRVESEGENCKAFYTKVGVDDPVGTAKQTKVCEEVVLGVQKNLESANWNCKSVSSKISK